MRKLITLFAAIVVMAGFSTTVLAQSGVPTAPVNSPAGAKIVQALSLTNTKSLHFGTMAIPTTDATVVVSVAGTRTLGSGSLVLLPQMPVAQESGFHVAGTPAATYSINLPINGTITIANGASTMAIDDFVANTASTSNPTTGTLDINGMDDFKIGATLKLTNGQTSGVYAGTFPVTICYN